MKDISSISHQYVIFEHQGQVITFQRDKTSSKSKPKIQVMGKETKTSIKMGI